MGKVRAIELDSGTTIMGEITIDHNGECTTTNMVVVHFTAAKGVDGQPILDESGKPKTQIAMTSFPPIAKIGAGIPLNKNNFVFGPYTPDDRFLELYERTMKEVRERTSGIKVVSSMPKRVH